MVKFRKTLLMSAALTITASSLIVGGCSPKDKGPGAQISVEAAPLGLTAPNEKVFARHFDVPARTVEDADATTALKRLGLESEGVMNWDSKTGSAGNYIYNNLGANSGENEVSIGRAELLGVHMADGEASFDRANFKDMVIKGDDVNLKIGAMSVARPTPKMAHAFMKALQTKDGFEDLDVQLDRSDKLSFGAISVDDITIDAEEMGGTVEHLVWGVEDSTGLGDGKIGKMDLTLKGKDDVSSTFTFDGASARSVNTKSLGDWSGSNDLGLGQFLGQLNVYEKPYDNYTIGKGVFKSENFDVSFDGFEGKATEKGDVTTITQLGKPIKLSFSKAPKDRQGARAYDMLKSLGFDEVTLKTSQTQIMDKKTDTITVKDGLIDMTDGFRLNYTYEAEGLSAMSAAAKEKRAVSDGKNGATTADDVLESLEPVKLRQLRVSLEDKSIVERGLKLAGEMSGQSPDTLKKQMKIAVMAAPFMAQNELESQVISEIGGAFVQFVDNGGTMTVEIDPPAPLSVKTLAEARENNLNPKDIGFSANVQK